MKTLAQGLTLVLAVLLTFTVTTSIESCCLPVAKPKNCCPPKACHCHLSPCATPQSSATVPAAAQAPLVAALPSFTSGGTTSDSLRRTAFVAVPRLRSLDDTPLYTRTHSFLI